MNAAALPLLQTVRELLDKRAHDDDPAEGLSDRGRLAPRQEGRLRGG